MGKVYTKTGDRGSTSLVGGTRISKSDPQIDLYGEIDELNSFIGFLLSAKPGHDLELIENIQINLFNLGSLLACEIEKREEYKLPQISKTIISELEDSIDEMDKSLDKLKNFILPGGCEAASRAHLCRVISRRVERKLTKINIDECPNLSIEFLNRLSDYFFILSRYLNKKENIKEILWFPNKED